MIIIQEYLWPRKYWNLRIYLGEHIIYDILSDVTTDRLIDFASAILSNLSKSVQVRSIRPLRAWNWWRAVVYASLYKSVFQYQLEISRFYSILFDFRLNIWNRTYYRTLFSWLNRNKDPNADWLHYKTQVTQPNRHLIIKYSVKNVQNCFLCTTTRLFITSGKWYTNPVRWKPDNQKWGSRPKKWTVHFMSLWFKAVLFWAFWPSTYTLTLKVIFSLFKYRWMFLTNWKPNLIWQDLWHDHEEIFRVSITLTPLEILMASAAQKWLHMYEFSNLIPKIPTDVAYKIKLPILNFFISQFKAYTNDVTIWSREWWLGSRRWHWKFREKHFWNANLELLLNSSYIFWP